MRPYFRKWFIIDLLTLFLGLGLTIAYVIFRHYYPDTKSNWFDIWPNISTELLGVWLSVRIIDAVIQSNNQKNNNRREIVRNIRYFTDYVEELEPNFDSWTIRTLVREKIMFSKRFQQRKKFLNGSELGKVKKYMIKSDLLVSKLELYTVLEGNISRLNYQYSKVFDNLNLMRDTFINKIQKQLADEQFVELSNIKYNDNFTDEEFNSIMLQVEKYRTVERGGYFIKVSNIRMYEVKEIKEFEALINRYEEVIPFTAIETLNAMMKISEDFKLKKTKYPNIVCNSIQEIFNVNIRKFLLLSELIKVISEIQSLYQEIETDIFEESSPFE